MANELASLADAPIGTGLASLARNTIGLRKAYNQYVINTQEAGQEPMTFEEWAKTQGI